MRSSIATNARRAPDRDRRAVGQRPARRCPRVDVDDQVLDRARRPQLGAGVGEDLAPHVGLERERRDRPAVLVADVRSPCPRATPATAAPGSSTRSSPFASASSTSTTYGGDGERAGGSTSWRACSRGRSAPRRAAGRSESARAARGGRREAARRSCRSSAARRAGTRGPSSLAVPACLELLGEVGADLGDLVARAGRRRGASPPAWSKYAPSRIAWPVPRFPWAAVWYGRSAASPPAKPEISCR